MDDAGFLELVRADPTVATVLDRAPALGLPDCWLTAGVLSALVQGPAASLREVGGTRVLLLLLT